MDKSVEAGEIAELVGAYKQMAPEARKILLDVARTYAAEFAAKRGVGLRLVVGMRQVN